MATKSKARKQELLAEIANGTTNQKIYDELMKLNQEEEKSLKARQSVVDGVIKIIMEHGIGLTEIRSAFSAAELRGLGGRAPGARKGAKRTTRRAGDILIADVKTASGKGAASNYHRGQKIPQYVPKAFKELYAANKDNFEAALKTHYTDAGKAYFATKDGKAELEAWVNFVKTRPVNPRQT